MVGGIFEVIFGSLALGGISSAKSIKEDTKAALDEKCKRIDEIQADDSLTEDQKYEKIKQVENEEWKIIFMSFGVTALCVLFMWGLVELCGAAHG